MTPRMILNQLASDARETRIGQRLTQTELANHAGVSLGLIKRFEGGGGINLHAFVRIAVALGRADALRELLRAAAPIAGLGIAAADLATVSIADLEAAQSPNAKPKVRVRHSRQAKGGAA